MRTTQLKKIRLYDARQWRVERDPWCAYCHHAYVKPLEAYARNYEPLKRKIECPILLEATHYAHCTLLTCCMQLVSDTAYREMKRRGRTVCPLCRQHMLTTYLHVVTGYGYKGIVGFDRACDTPESLRRRLLLACKTEFGAKMYYRGYRLLPETERLRLRYTWPGAAY